jgi:adenylate cyclase
MEMRRPYYLALATECHMAAARFAEAGERLDEALAIVAKTGECWSEAELIRLRGELEARDDVAAAEASLHQALEIARQQGAKSWELRAAVSLARLWHRLDRSDAAGDVLRPVHDWFAEGFDTPDLIEAKALLGTLETV